MKYKNIFAKGYIPNRSEKVFVIKKVKNTEPLTYVISDVNSEEIAGTIYVQELQKTNQTEFKRKGDKLYAKWKGDDHLFNKWIDEKDIVA